MLVKLKVNPLIIIAIITNVIHQDSKFCGNDFRSVLLFHAPLDNYTVAPLSSPQDRTEKSITSIIS
jgi:hypothetical protein